jgi:hypothetical protein
MFTKEAVEAGQEAVAPTQAAALDSMASREAAVAQPETEEAVEDAR